MAVQQLLHHLAGAEPNRCLRGDRGRLPGARVARTTIPPGKDAKTTKLDPLLSGKPPADRLKHRVQRPFGITLADAR